MLRAEKVDRVEIWVGSTSLKPCKPFNCILPREVCADLVLTDNTAIDEYSAVIVAGGDVWEYMPKGVGHGPVTSVIRRALAKQKIVGAICTGQAVLAAGGFMNEEGKKIAPSKYLEPYLFEMKPNGPKWGLALTKVYRSGQVIVAATPTQGEEFGRAILDAIAEKK